MTSRAWPSADTRPPKVQYFCGLPAGLVWVHAANSALI